MARDWPQHVEREEARYRDGISRLPSDPDARQKQLTRAGNAALGAGFAHLMLGERESANRWLRAAAERYRQSYSDAPPGSWGRLIGALKMRIVSGDWPSARAEARWVLDQAPQAGSAIGRYAACVAQLVLEQDVEAGRLAASLRAEDDAAFPDEVARALEALATGDAARYRPAVGEIVASFESRDEYLEDVPIADTALMMEALAARRGLAARPSSRLLPPDVANAGGGR